ncbi:hypothetical protein Goarm_002175 [Gossypium armourianum]|uniref:RING-type domain-containing protein n=1 Tax=Gossypium armourianum TaxID=34283 RepID=A0A7J9K789_9ROSI|nr:hypothetical protein [Gossypium armourianum]
MAPGGILNASAHTILNVLATTCSAGLQAPVEVEYLLFWLPNMHTQAMFGLFLWLKFKTNSSYKPVLTQQHQSDEVKTNKDSTPLVKKSGTNATSVSRLSNKKENTTQPPKDATTSLFKSRGTSTIMESKQLTLKSTAQPLKDPAGLAKVSEISGSETTQSPRKPKTVENGRNSGTLASKHAMQNKETVQPPKDPAGFFKNGETSRVMASKHVMQKREKSQHPKNPLGLVKNIGTSVIPASTHSMQNKKAIHWPEDSASPVTKIENSARSPQLIQKKEKKQPSENSAGAVSGSRLATHKKVTTLDSQRQKQHISIDHIVWEGFGDDIVPLEKSCLSCDGDLANEPEYYLDMASLNPAENAVLSCGHVFHSMCLRQTIAEEKCRDPPCIICASSLS